MLKLDDNKESLYFYYSSIINFNDLNKIVYELRKVTSVNEIY